MGPYKNLKVWQESVDLVTLVYQVTASYPKSEQFGLVSQMRRCVVSIPSNIAEGYGRGTNGDLIHFLSISLGSSNELDTQLILSRRLSFITEETFALLVEMNASVWKMINSLIYVRKNVIKS